ncbi:MAG: hypothetical protein LBT03_00610 [Holosporales bacterium]|jgi:hypothetical protein|nr:hypothetical protein [Holosporales bacterium]
MNINELLNGYTCTNGRWHERGQDGASLSRDDLLRLLQQKLYKPGIKKKEVVLLIFKHATENRGPCPVTEYPIVGGNRNQMAHITNARREPIETPSGDPDRETPLPDADAQVLRERIGEGRFDRVERIGWSDTKPITITLEWVRIGAKCGQVKLFINVIDGIISLGKIMFRP